MLKKRSFYNLNYSVLITLYVISIINNKNLIVLDKKYEKSSKIFSQVLIYCHRLSLIL